MAEDRADDDMAADAPGRLPAGTTRTELGGASGTEAAAMEARTPEQEAGASAGSAETFAAGTPTEANQREQRGGSRDPKVFVLLRELSEVHLLLDNLSANPTTTVSELSLDRDPNGQKLDLAWIEKVCRISWPPTNTNEEKAEDAALLIWAKDRLNRMSYPASGATIAFTLLVTQDETVKSRTTREGRLGNDDEPPTRHSLAKKAYPDLVRKAAKFRQYMTWMCAGLLAALALTCALSWYVAYGNEALAELRTTRSALAEAENQLVAAAAQEAEAPTPSTANKVISIDQYCSGADPLTPQGQHCAVRTRSNEVLERTEERLSSWTCWYLWGDCVGENVDAPFMTDAPSHAAALATILGSAVLPFLYGLLGAGAAIIRSLSRKIRASLLSPRDLHLSFQQLALGAVVGACIGLFVAAPESNATGESLLGPVTLSASAISFVAGFGVDSVFQALEALITRIFNVTQAPTGNRGDGLPTN